MSNVAPETERGTKPALGAYFIIPLLACGLTTYFLVSTRGLIWEARATGTFIGVILLGLCVAQFIRLGLKVVRGEATLGFGDLVENTLFNRQRLALLALMVAFIVGLPFIGTTVGLFLVMIAMMWVMGVRSWLSLVAVATATSAAVHLLLIYLLGSQLPQGVFKSFFTFGG
jgi:hypothetical protein